jgi:putative ABC transport system substrate-binding protein
MKRRTFIAGLGGAAVWPVVARAQQGDRVRRIGVFLLGDENDPASKPLLSAFTQALAELGWTDGRNVRASTSANTGRKTKIPRAAKTRPMIAIDGLKATC